MIDEKRFSKSSSKEISQNTVLKQKKTQCFGSAPDVDSFDEDAVSLYTEAGLLNIKGTELKINKLSLETGEVIVEGEINALEYSDEEKIKGTSLLKKLFK